jgi:hypothetical protein
MTLRQRFDAKWQLDPETGCWLWTAATNLGGYGLLRITEEGQRRMEVASRTSWQLFVGPIPDDLCVLHHCDTPPCVNPEHLFLGTRADNAADRDAKGRHRHGTRRGEEHSNARITEMIAREILALRGVGLSQPAVGARYGVSRQLVSAIWRGEAWAHLGG